MRLYSLFYRIPPGKAIEHEKKFEKSGRFPYNKGHTGSAAGPPGESAGKKGNLSMKKAAEEIYRWAREGTELSPPAWAELPSIPLYMDQVIFYLKDSLRFFERDEETSLLTSSMINNYVKNGVLPHPDKKKYGKEHLGALMAVCMLKQVLSIQEIKTLLSGEELSEELYELFRSAHSSAVQQTCIELEKSCEAGENLKEAALRLAAEANAKRAAAERVLCELAKEETPREKPSKNEK